MLMRLMYGMSVARGGEEARENRGWSEGAVPRAREAAVWKWGSAEGGGSAGAVMARGRSWGVRGAQMRTRGHETTRRADAWQE